MEFFQNKIDWDPVEVFDTVMSAFFSGAVFLVSLGYFSRGSGAFRRSYFLLNILGNRRLFVQVYLGRLFLYRRDLSSRSFFYLLCRKNSCWFKFVFRT